MISKFSEFEEICNEINKELKEKVTPYVIGGAALLYYKADKEVTKDIDIVFDSLKELRAFGNALKKMGFKVTITPHSHHQLNIFERLERDKYMFDLFVSVVCSQFSLSKTMMKRAEKAIDLDKLKVHICSKEDIVLFKSLSSSRKGDIEDSMSLISRGVDWNIIYDEIVVQSSICKDKEKSKRMIFYFLERVHDDLEPRGVRVPISDKVMDFYNTL